MFVFFLRCNEKEPVRIYALYEPAKQLDKAKRGKHTATYTEYIANLINREIKLTAEEIETTVQDRKEWKKLVTECTKRYNQTYLL